MILFDKEIKLVSFDLWQTVIKEDDEFLRLDMRANFICEMFDLQFQRVRAEIDDLAKVITAFHKKNQKTMKTRQRVELLLKNLDVFYNSKQLEKTVEYFSNVSLFLPPQLMPGIADFLRFLKTENLKIVMISDTGYTHGKDMRELLKIHRIFDFFDFFVFSDEVDVAKPSRKSFEIVEKEFLDIKPKEMLHIGDNPETDVLGALNSNWNAVVFGEKRCDKNVPRIKSFV